jgi:hypothetical protein
MEIAIGRNEFGYYIKLNNSKGETIRTEEKLSYEDFTKYLDNFRTALRSRSRSTTASEF